MGKYFDLVSENFWKLDKEVELVEVHPVEYPVLVIALQHLSLKKPMTIERLIRNRVKYYWVLYGGIPVGVIGTRAWTYYGLELLHIVIFPEYRNKGIGRYAIAKLIDMSDKLTFYANVNENNVASKKIFEMLKFKPAVNIINKGDRVIGYILNKQELVGVEEVEE